MVTKGVTVPVSWPTSGCLPSGTPTSLMVPSICTLTQGSEQGHSSRALQGPTLEEISHCLNGATCFFKLDTKDNFWGIHLDEKSSYLTTFNMHHDSYRFLYITFWSEDVPGCLSDVHGPGNGLSPWHYCHTWWYMHLWSHSWGAWLAPLKAHADSSPAWHCLQQLKVLDQTTTDQILQCCVHHKRQVARSLQDPRSTRPPSSKALPNFSHS